MWIYFGFKGLEFSIGQRWAQKEWVKVTRFFYAIHSFYLIFLVFMKYLVNNFWDLIYGNAQELPLAQG